MGSSNFTFMVYGFLAAWMILFAYVVSLARREGRITREIENLRQLMEERRGPANGFIATTRPPATRVPSPQLVSVAGTESAARSELA